MIASLSVFFISLGTACLTLYSGFGLGTILLPVFALFFPLQVAIGATAIVHGANNLIKALLVGKQADWGIALRFGIPAVAAAFLGAWCMTLLAEAGMSLRYSLGALQGEITPLKTAIALLMVVFALFDLLPALREIRLHKKFLIAGGLVSGFFGGFSGHQGALRSTFLTKVGLGPGAFVGTTAVTGLMVDAARLAVYGTAALHADRNAAFSGAQWMLIGAGIAGAFIGLEIGRRFLHKITMKTIRRITGIMLIGIALLMGAGLI